MNLILNLKHLQLSILLVTRMVALTNISVRRIDKQIDSMSKPTCLLSVQYMKKNIEFASQLGNLVAWSFPKIDHWVSLSNTYLCAVIYEYSYEEDPKY